MAGSGGVKGISSDLENVSEQQQTMGGGAFQLGEQQMQRY